MIVQRPVICVIRYIYYYNYYNYECYFYGNFKIKIEGGVWI